MSEIKLKIMLNFKMDAPLEDAKKIGKIAKRAVEFNPNLDHLDTVMDLTACHLNDTKLDLDRMLNADEGNLLHDVYGINRHLDRNTGKLLNAFLPRFNA